MIFEESIAIASDHPMLPGHFPGNPIVPGAVLLDMAASVAQHRLGLRVIGIRRARFKTPLLPETECTLQLSTRDESSWDLTCQIKGTTVLVAILDCTADLDGQ